MPSHPRCTQIHNQQKNSISYLLPNLLKFITFSKAFCDYFSHLAFSLIKSLHDLVLPSVVLFLLSHKENPEARGFQFTRPPGRKNPDHGCAELSERWVLFDVKENKNTGAGKKVQTKPQHHPENL